MRLELLHNFLAQWLGNIEWARQLVCGSAPSHIGTVSNRTDFVSDKSNMLRTCAYFFKLLDNELLPLNIASAPPRPSGVINQSDAGRIEHGKNERGARQANSRWAKQEATRLRTEAVVRRAESVRDAAPVRAENPAAARGDLASATCGNGRINPEIGIFGLPILQVIVPGEMSKPHSVEDFFLMQDADVLLSCLNDSNGDGNVANLSEGE